MTTEQYINIKFPHAKKEGRHVVTDCVFCGKEKHMYINLDTGAWDCKKGCDAGKTIYKIKEYFGDIEPVSSIGSALGITRKVVLPDQKKHIGYNKALLSSERWLGWLLKHKCINRDTVSKLLIGLTPGGELSIPHVKKGKVVNIKYFKYDYNTGKKSGKPRQEKDAEKILYNQDCIDSSTSKVIVTEGEWDAITLLQIRSDAKVVGNTGGASTWKPEWTALLYNCMDIWLAYDNDEAGQKCVQKPYNALGKDRCTILIPPLNDINDCICDGMSWADILEKGEVLESKMDELGHISAHLERVVKNIGNKEYIEGLPLPLKCLESVVKLRCGELNVITGETNHGKTTFTNYLLYNWAKSDHPVCFMSLELTIDDIVEQLMSMDSGKSYFNGMSGQDAESTGARLSNMPIYFYNKFGKVSADNLYKAIKFARRKYGVRNFVVDSLQYFSDTAGSKYGTSEERIREALINFNIIAKDMDVNIILTVQGNARKEVGKKVELEHLKGASAISQMAWNIIRVWANIREETDKAPYAEITNLKTRKRTGQTSTGGVKLSFDRDSCLYSDTHIDTGVDSPETSIKHPRRDIY